MGASLSIRNMHWTAAANEQAQQDLLDTLTAKRQRNEQAIENSKSIRELTTQAEYDAWWSGTPDDSAGFYSATVAKLDQLNRNARK